MVTSTPLFKLYQYQLALPRKNISLSTRMTLEWRFSKDLAWKLLKFCLAKFNADRVLPSITPSSTLTMNFTLISLLGNESRIIRVKYASSQGPTMKMLSSAMEMLSFSWVRSWSLVSSFRSSITNILVVTHINMLV